MANLKNTEIDNNLELPSGTTAQRPSSPEEGQIRYNTDLAVTEFYNGSNWRPLSDTHAEATGGTVVDTDIGGVPYRIHYFTNVGTDTLTVTNPGEVEYLIVAGGGSGGNHPGAATHGAGGGGAGGLLTGTILVTPQAYAVTVGAGGNEITSSGVGNSGNDSSALGLTALGGGGGGYTTGNDAKNGGSGGGAGGGTDAGSGISGQGNDGGTTSDIEVSGAGGGGAGTAGQNSTGEAGDGGQGITSNITGNTNFYAGGGGGGRHSSFSKIASGGLGGGGRGGGQSQSEIALPGEPNTGGGGGGGNDYDPSVGAAGGSGIVIVRYPRNSSLDSEPDETRPSYQPYFYARDVRPIIARDGLVLELDAANPLSYPGTGTTWQDLSGNGNDGTLVNGVGYDSTNNGSMVFDGTDQYVNIPSFYDFSITNSITVFAWVKSVGSTWNDTGWIVSKRDQFIIHPDRGSRNVDFYINDGSWNKVEFAPQDIQKWHLYCLRYDGNILDAFFDGNLVDSSNLSTTLNSDTGALTVGRDDGSSGRYGEGNISNVQIYNRALTEAEIKQNFNALRGRYGI